MPFRLYRPCRTSSVAITRFPKHLVFYRIEDQRVVILRVIHGARNLEDLL